MRSFARPVSVVFALTAVLTVALGCGPVPLADGYATDASAAGRCTTCHGTHGSGAPPRSLTGSVEVTERGVGAHRAHLRDGAMRGAVNCSECHVVPDAVGAEGHVDALPAEVTFGPLATARDFDARWNVETLRCATACHGGGMPLGGGTLTEPKWTATDGAAGQCGACHGTPPPAPHPASRNCALCHAETVGADGAILVAAGKHIDGVVQSKARGTSCTSCHGDDDGGAGDVLGAPPRDLSGNEASTARGVGAHAVHLDGERHLPVECDACHVVPARVGDPLHADDDDLRAEITLGGLAVHEQREPTYMLAETGCANTYCHGDGTAPVWTDQSGTYSACNSCHGAPPAAPHPARTDCAACHGMVVAPSLVDATAFTFVAPELHVNGTVESEGVACTSCHGTPSTGQPAPPRDTLGNVATTARGVGAHASHLAALAGPGANPQTYAAIACSECHVVPVANDDGGHFDTSLPAEVTFGPRARARGATPSFDGVGCSNVACHGGTSTTPGATPSWTIVNGSQAACGTCHGLPPPAPHPATSNAIGDCARCHGMVIDAAAAFVAPALHVNGSVEVSCTACHGDAAAAAGAGSPAPPRDLAGNTSTSFIGVGAHRTHVEKNVPCSECHLVPATLASTGHRDDGDDRAEVRFGPLARADGTDAQFNGLTCATYCHGGSASIRGGTLTTPTWTVAEGSEGSQTACGTCHGLPPPAPHPATPPTGCGGCHPFSGLLPLNPALHINGVVERP